MDIGTPTIHIENTKLDNNPNQYEINQLNNLTADPHSPGQPLQDGTLPSHSSEPYLLGFKTNDDRFKFVKVENEDQGNASYEYQDLDKNGNYHDRLQAQEELLPLTPFKNLEHERSNIDNHLQKPFDPSFNEFCAAELSPIHSRLQTPLSFAKSSLGKNNEFVLKLNSPALKLDGPKSPLFGQSRRQIQKLEFTAPKSASLSQLRREDIKVESSGHKEHSSEHKRMSNLQYDENIKDKPENKSPDLSRLQKSQYNTSNPLSTRSNHLYSSTNNSTGTLITNISDDLSFINKSLREKENHNHSLSNLKVHESPLNSHDPRGDETTPVQKSSKTKKFCLDTMNSFVSRDSNNIESLFTSRKNLAKVYQEINTPPDFKADEERNNLPSPTASVQEAKKVTCNCKKSKCLKLYCDCFSVNMACSPECNCSNCYNNEKHAADRNKARDSVLERNPAAFQPKIDKKLLAVDKAKIDDGIRHFRGCNCKKSGCLKKYCECYAAGVKCSELCKCDSCRNMDPSTCQKKVQNLLSMSLPSQEKSITSAGEAQSEKDIYEHDRYLRNRAEDEEEERAYKSDSLRKKVKKIPHQIDSFNSFGSINMINEMIKNKHRLSSANKSLNAGSEEKSLKKNGSGATGHVRSSSKSGDPKVIDFYDDAHSEDKVRKSSTKHGRNKGRGDVVVKGEY